MKETSYYPRLTKYYAKERNGYAYKIPDVGMGRKPFDIFVIAGKSLALDAKFTRTNRLPYSCLYPHQEEALLKCVEGGADGYVVVIFYVPRKTEVYEIDVRKFVQEKYEKESKSLTKERAKEIGKRIYI